MERLSRTKLFKKQELVECAGKVIEEIGVELIVVTLGDQGIFTYDKTGTSKFIPAEKTEYFVVTGTGDTVNSIIALGIIGKLPV